MSLIIGVVLNLILPKEMGMPFFEITSVEAVTSIGALLLLWLKNSAQMALLIFVIIASLNIIYKLLLKYHLIAKLSKAIEPILKFFGLPVSTAFLWLIGYIVGLAYGGALMIDQMKEGRVSKEEADTLNYHLAVSHSILEDNLLFVALGVSFGLVLAVRLTAAWLVVWIRTFWLKITQKRVATN